MPFQSQPGVRSHTCEVCRGKKPSIAGRLEAVQLESSSAQEDRPRFARTGGLDRLLFERLLRGVSLASSSRRIISPASAR